MAAEPRLYVLLARDAHTGVVFRRGPSKQVLLVSWDLDTDTFVPGQWLKGRVYEDRCDLSPGGDLLVYFAADQKPPYSTWTAISRPPYLTALALWPKGDTWGGGGIFEDSTTVGIDHGEHEMSLADGFTLPPWLRVTPMQSGDSPWGVRTRRDGWQLTSEPGKLSQRSYMNDTVQWVPPQIWEKPQPHGRHQLRMTHTELTRTRPWYVANYELVDGAEVSRLGHIEWADWDRNGDLLFAMNGALYRLPQEDGALPPLEDAHVVADFAGMKFEPRAPSEEAKRWPVR